MRRALQLEAARLNLPYGSVGAPQRVTTDVPTKTVLELAARFEGEVPELVVERPSLEDVYLRMIGDPS